MARELQQILTELNAVYDPQKQNYNQQIQSLDPAMQAEEKGLSAAKEDAFSQITAGANRRGLLFSGIPIEEQARYTGSQYLPSVANLKSRYATQRFNLQDALAKVTADQYNTAYGIRQKEVDTEAAAAAAAASARAAAGNGFNPTFGGGGGNGGQVLGANDINVNELYSYLDSKYKANPNASRAEQDSWVRAWSVGNGLDPNAANDPYGVWGAYNNKYPWEKYNKTQIGSPGISAPGLSTAIGGGRSVLPGLQQASGSSGAGGW